MREILFRGKPLGNYFHGKFIYGSLGVIDTGLCAIYHCFEFNDDEMQLVDSGSVGQFTGLTDKNGKKIFEGDILRRAYHPEDDVVIEWFDGSFRFRKANKPKDYGYSNVCCVQNAVSRLKIIGNIHDNPELLEVKE